MVTLDNDVTVTEPVSVGSRDIFSTLSFFVVADFAADPRAILFILP